MLNRQQLQKYDSTLGFNIYQIEKDYIQHIVLFYLSKIVGNELVFKGGTALQKCYGLDRFSEDLDFTSSGALDFEILVSNVLSELTKFGFESEQAKKLENEFSFSSRIKVKGPLFDGNEISVCTLYLEISKRDKILIKPENLQISPVYIDIPPYNLLTMKQEEIFSEKIRTVLERDKARDLYDLWYLTVKGKSPRKSIIEKKIGAKFSKKDFESSLMKKKKGWEKLSNYTNRKLDFEEAYAVVLSGLDKFT